jgi:hypothetical protein
MSIMLLIFSDQRQKEIKMKIGGPFLQMAVFCEKVLHEKDGVLSAIRIIDRVTHSISAETIPDSMPAINFPVTAVICFKSGDATGKYEVKIKTIPPSGEEVATFSGPILFTEEKNQGANIVINMMLAAKQEGIYWFDVMLNDQLVTRMPFQIIYHRVTSTTTAQPVH